MAAESRTLHASRNVDTSRRGNHPSGSCATPVITYEPMPSGRWCGDVTGLRAGLGQVPSEEHSGKGEWN